MAAQAQAQPLQFFGRVFSIVVTPQDGSPPLTIASSTFPQSVRVSFTIDMVMLIAYWQATITIWNMANADQITQGTPFQSGQTGNVQQWNYTQPLALGNTVTISGGYQATGASVLYQGKILQSIWKRIGVVDWQLVLRCQTGLLEDALNIINKPVAKGQTAYQAIQTIAQKATNPIPFPEDNIDAAALQTLSNQNYSRSSVFFGRPYLQIKAITDQYNLWTWVGPNGLNVRTFNQNTPPPAPPFVYGPYNIGASQNSGTSSGSSSTTIRPTVIGTPEQTQDGIVFKVLMDSYPVIGGTVQLAPGTIINPVYQQYGSAQGMRVAAPPQDGIYYVNGVRHVGDTRGTETSWYTEVSAVVPNFFAQFLGASSAPGTSGSQTSTSQPNN